MIRKLRYWFSGPVPVIAYDDSLHRYFADCKQGKFSVVCTDEEYPAISEAVWNAGGKSIGNEPYTPPVVTFERKAKIKPCTHENKSEPRWKRFRANNWEYGSYRLCLDCGEMVDLG